MPHSRPAASRVVHVPNALVSGGVYRDPPPSTRPRRIAPLGDAGSEIRRHSAGLVKWGLSRAAVVKPEARGRWGWPVGDGSAGARPGLCGGSSGFGGGESSNSGSASSGRGSSAAVSGNPGCAPGSTTTILVIRRPAGALDDVRDPGVSRAAPVRRPVSGTMLARGPQPDRVPHAFGTM